jgi:hypothetical protein
MFDTEHGKREPIGGKGEGRRCETRRDGGDMKSSKVFTDSRCMRVCQSPHVPIHLSIYEGGVYDVNRVLLDRFYFVAFDVSFPFIHV